MYALSLDCKKELQPKRFLKGGDGIKGTLPRYTHQTVPCCTSERNLQVAGAYCQEKTMHEFEAVYL